MASVSKKTGDSRILVKPLIDAGPVFNFIGILPIKLKTRPALIRGLIKVL